MYRIQYDDISGAQTTITWYSVASAGNAPYDFCATGNPLRFKWYGGRYDTIRGSSIAFNVLIRNQTDRTNIYNLMNAPHYVRIQKQGQNVWLGRVFPVLFTEVLEPFPYVIQIKATDQLGRLDQYRPLMVDFPEPFDHTAPGVNVLDVLNSFLTDASFAPAASQPTAPMRLNVSMSIYWNSIKRKAFEATHLDMLAFMEDDDRYQSKHDILDAILKPFQCKLYQWRGEWWLMSWDAEWNHGDFEYERYSLDWTAGWTWIKHNVINVGVFQLFDDCKQVKGSASMEFLPAWQGIDYKMNYKKTTNIGRLFANGSGNFYRGVTNIPLEFNPTPVANRLRHWTYSGSLVAGPNVDNDGWLSVKSYTTARTEYVQKRIFLNGHNDIGGIAFSADLSFIRTPPFPDSLENRFKMSVVLTSTAGNVFYLWLNNGNPEWSDAFTPHTFEFSEGFDVNMPLPGTVTTVRELDIKIYPAYSNASTVRDALLRNFKLSVVNPDFEQIDYKEENLFNFYLVSAIASEPPTDIEFSWGMSHPTFNNHHDFTLTSPYDSAGAPMSNAWMKEPTTDALGVTQPLKQWMIAELTNDNKTVTRKIKGNFVVNDLRTDIQPYRVIQDKEGKYYQFVSGEFDDKNLTWNGVEFIEFKGYKT